MVLSEDKTPAEEAAEKEVPYVRRDSVLLASSHAAQSEASDSTINLMDVSEEPRRYEKERGGQWMCYKCLVYCGNTSKFCQVAVRDPTAANHYDASTSPCRW